MSSKAERILNEAGISATPVRILVLKCLDNSSGPLSLNDIEIRLDSVDKSSISRALNLFKENHLVHSFTDGSGSTKFEVCRSRSEESDADRHVHFRCEKCGVTLCLTDVAAPTVELPEGFEMHEVNYVITGVCADCSRHK